MVENGMTVDELRDALSYVDGRRIVKIYGNGSMDDDIAEVHEDEVNKDRPVATVTIVTKMADNSLKTLLDAFFIDKLTIEAPGYYLTPMTTMDIIDKLDPMMDVNGVDLIKYMTNNGYQIKPQHDGLPRWVLYTKIDT